MNRRDFAASLVGLTLAPLAPAPKSPFKVVFQAAYEPVIPSTTVAQPDLSGLRCTGPTGIRYSDSLESIWPFKQIDGQLAVDPEWKEAPFEEVCYVDDSFDRSDTLVGFDHS